MERGFVPPRKKYKQEEEQKAELALMDFQKQGVERILQGYSSTTYLVPSLTQDGFSEPRPTHCFLLFDEMGLGKTVQALEAQRCMLPQLNRPSLVIGPAGCIHVWKETADKFYPGLFDVRYFIGDDANPSTLANMTARTLLVTSYDTLRNAYFSYLVQTLPLGQMSTPELYQFCKVYLPCRSNLKLRRIMETRQPESVKRSELLKIAKQVWLTLKQKKKHAQASLSSKYQAYRQFVHTTYSVLIMDEAHRMKNSESATTRAVACMLARFRLALTGTPIMNNGNELLTLFRFSLGLLDADWSAIYNEPNGAYWSHLRKTVMLGRKKADIPEIKQLLPERKKEHERILLHWNMFPEAEATYVKVKNQSLRAYKQAFQVRKFAWETHTDYLARRAETTQTFWAKFQRLRQICLHPLLPQFQLDGDFHKSVGTDIPTQVRFTADTAFLFPRWVKRKAFYFLLCLNKSWPALYQKVELRYRLCHYFIQTQRFVLQPSAKMLAFYRIYKQTQRQENKQKVIAISHFRTFLEKILGPWLTSMGVKNVLFAGGHRKKQELALQQFKEDDSVRVMLIVKKAGAHGINLQEVASTAVLFDPHFNEGLDEQSVARIDRIGQVSDEIIIRKLEMQGSVDRALYQMQESKTEQNNAWLGRSDGKLSLEAVGLFLSKYDTVGNH